ncbi:MAG TPA: MMPL family transporter [Verrucomicrobiae bacterium]|nr:MMPL family transporter [Verrucomicrobiae bacterium]
MTAADKTFFGRALRVLARAVCRHPGWFIYPQIVLFALSVFVTLRNWNLDMNRDNLVGSDKSYHRAFLKFRAEFPGEDELAVIVQSESMERNRQFVERLAAKLEPETNLFTDVFYKGDLRSLGPKALLFVPPADLRELDNTLSNDLPFLQPFTQATNLDSFFELINTQFRTAKQEKNAQNDALLNALPAVQRIVEQASASISMPGNPVSPGVNALFGQGKETEQRLYITFADGQIYLVTARARNADVQEDAVKRMRQLMHETELEVPGLNVGLTGEPVLEYDEMRQSEHDSIMASIVSLVVCSLIFIYAYKQTGRPLKAVLCLIIGLGYTMGFTFLTIGHLNILTITFAPILIGLAIDFGVHFITRFEEEMRRGVSPAEAVEIATVFTGQGIVTGALTTAGAFLAMGLTDFKGIQEMGIISGGGLALCLIPMMTLLPILLMKGRQNVIDHAASALQRRAHIESFWLDRPIPVVAIVLALTGLAVSQFGKVFFDYNLLDMQSRGLPAVVYEKKLLYSGQSVLFAAIVATNLQEARNIELRVKKLPSVASVDGDDKGESIYDILTQDQSQKLELVSDIKAKLAALHFRPPDTEPVAVHDLSRTLWSAMGYLALAADATKTDEPALSKQLLSLRSAISTLRVKMGEADPATLRRLLEYQEALFNDIADTFQALKAQETGSAPPPTGDARPAMRVTRSERLEPQDLPPALRNRFVGKTGKFMVQVFPKKDVWQHENQREFVTDLRHAMEPHPERVTGTPVQLFEYTTLLKESYQQAALYALAAIAIMVFLHFRSFVCVILSLLPVAVGTAWTVGIMGATHIPFNPANIMTLPLVIGIGVTNGIHILNRFAEELHAGILSKSTGKAVLVSGLTAVTGFGSLILAKHQGIQSLGLVMSIGIAACMIAGLTFLPALLNILVRLGWSLGPKRPGADNAKPAPGLEEPR